MPTVLLVEENPADQAIYTLAVRNFGFELFTTGDGEETIRLTREPHLVLAEISIALTDDRGRAAAAACDGYFTTAIDSRRTIPEVERLLSALDGPVAPTSTAAA